MEYLVTLDTQAIQNYLYQAGKLRDAVGGSYMVNHATETLVKETLQVLNIAQNEHLWYCGGGNARILFDSQEQAYRFIRAYTAKVALEMPKLQVAVYCDSFNMNDLQRELSRHATGMDMTKYQPQSLPRFQRIGFEELCPFTGEPVVARDQQRVRVGASCEKRAQYADESNEAIRYQFWENMDFSRLSHIRPAEYEFPKELDLLGGDEGQNYIAVIHIDANGMGKAFQTLQKNLTASNRNLLQQLSNHVKDASEKAVQFIMRSLAEEIDASYTHPDTMQQRLYPAVSKKVTLNQKGDKKWLPVRPVLQGGDDLTLVCDGRLGLCLATGYLNKFKQLSEEFLRHQPEITRHLNRTCFTGCAGIAIVKAHYPFRHAYALAEALLDSAKQIGRTDSASYNALDFHIVSETSKLDLKYLRQQRYSFIDGRARYLLTRKPYYVGNAPAHAHNPTLASYYGHLGSAKDLLAHNKLKELEGALSKGAKETTRLVEYLKGNYTPPQHSSKTKDDLERWIITLSGTGELKDSFFQTTGPTRSTFLLDIMEGERLLVQKCDALAEDGLKQDIFWS